ncbi:MAG: hypothetical protein Q9188_006408 [Gyalolechia gomerana]
MAFRPPAPSPESTDTEIRLFLAQYFSLGNNKPWAEAELLAEKFKEDGRALYRASEDELAQLYGITGRQYIFYIHVTITATYTVTTAYHYRKEGAVWLTPATLGVLIHVLLYILSRLFSTESVLRSPKIPDVFKGRIFGAAASAPADKGGSLF